MLILVLLTGCVGQREVRQTDSTPKVKESAKSDQTSKPNEPVESAKISETDDLETTDASDEVIIVDQPSDYPEIGPLIEGSVSFEADSSNQVSVDFLADGTEKSVTLKDSNGLIWELVIPADALKYEQTITMTAMKSINSSLGEISGGVVLQPDGLNFTTPVRLSVRGESIGTSGLIFSGNSKGEELDLPIAQESQDSVEVMLYHFSTAYVTSDQQSIDNIVQDAEDSIRKLTALAKQILKRPIEVPVPPAISLKCRHNTKEEDKDKEKLSDYLKVFHLPEGRLISALIAARKRIGFATGTSPDYGIELELMRRLIKKGSMLLKQYRGQEDMYLAVAAATLSVERQITLMGEPLDEDHSFVPAVADWACDIAQKYLNELVKQHQYKNIHPIMKLITDAALLSSPRARDLLDQLEQAVTFEVETTNTVKIGVGSSIGTYVVESRTKFMILFVSEKGLVGGNGQGVYKSFEVPALEDSEIELTLDQLGNTFDVMVGLDGFVPCSSDTFKVLIDRFGAESETLTAKVPEVPPTYNTRPVVQQACEKGFADKKQDGLYAFPVTLQNGQKVTAEQTFKVSDKGLDIEFQVKLIHMP